MKKTDVRFLRIDYMLITVILILAFVVRLYKIDSPLADYQSWRQVDTAAVARNFVRTDFNLLQPRYDDLSSIQSGLENPQGYRFVEFPLYNGFFAFLYRFLPLFSLEVYGRLVTIFFSLIVIFSVYYLTYKEADRFAAVAAALIYSVFPFFVFFSRVILPETTALGFAFMSILFLYAFNHREKPAGKIIFFTLSVISIALSLLIKPTTIFFLLPLLYLFFQSEGLNFIKKWYMYVFFLLAGLPLIVWRLYIQQFPEGVPASEWLIFQVNTFEGLKTIFLRPAFFRWIFFERINNYIFGGFLSVFFILGLIVKQKKYLLYSILVASLAYLMIFEGGNVQHEYYQTLIFPALAIFAGLGFSFIINNKKIFLPLWITYPVLILIAGFSLLMSYYKVKDYYSYPPDFPQISQIIRTLTKPEDKIVTDRSGDTTLLYLIDRQGAPATYKELEELKNMGYTHFVTLNKETSQTTKDKGLYEVVFENDIFTLFRL